MTDEVYSVEDGGYIQKVETARLAGSNVYGEQLYDRIGRKGQDWKGADRISVE